MEVRPLLRLARFYAAGGVIRRVGGGVNPSPIFLFGSRVYVCEAVGVVTFGGDSGCVNVLDCGLVVVEEKEL